MSKYSFVLLALLGACLGSSESPSVNSETHFLTMCASNADCGDPRACSCGFCTVKCDPLASACGQCVATTSFGAECAAELPGASLCAAGCTSQADCGAMVCDLQLGICKPPPDDPIADDQPEVIDGLGDAACPGQLLYYSPGCADAAPRCVTEAEDLCAGTGCSCGGESISIGCGFHSEPFASFGACPESDVDDDSTSPADAPAMCDGVNLCGNEWLEVTVRDAGGDVLSRFVGTGTITWEGETWPIACDGDGSSTPGITCAPDDGGSPWFAKGTVNVAGQFVGAVDASASVTLTRDDGASFSGSTSVTSGMRSTGSDACAQTCRVFDASVTLGAPTR